MKKKLLFIGLMLALSLGASAQDQEFSFGLRLGPNFNWIGSRAGAAENHGDKSGINVDFDFGFVAEYYFTENYALVTGVNVNFLRGQYDFADKRVIGSNDTILGTISRTFKTTVFEIPLMFKMVTPELGSIPLRLYAQLGGAFGVSPRVKVKDIFPLGGIVEDQYRVAKGEYNPIHASLRVGIGANYEILETMKVFLGCYYSYDILNGISSGVQGITSNYRKYYNGNKAFGERDVRLDIHHHRIGIEVGVLF